MFSIFCNHGEYIYLGDNFYANLNCVILDGAIVKIGNNVMLGSNVHIYTINHPLDVEMRNSWLEIAKSVNIGNNVWIGGNSTILPGVNIGDNSIIGAGSVVLKDIPSNVLAVGNPCVVKKKLN